MPPWINETLPFQESNFLGNIGGIAIITLHVWEAAFHAIWFYIYIYIFFSSWDCRNTMLIINWIVTKTLWYQKTGVTKIPLEALRPGLHSPKSFVEQVSRTWRSQGLVIFLWWCILWFIWFLKITPEGLAVEGFRLAYWLFSICHQILVEMICVETFFIQPDRP